MKEQAGAEAKGPDHDQVWVELHQARARFEAFVSASTDIVYRVSPDWSELWQVDGRGIVADTTAPRREWAVDYIIDEDLPKLNAAIARAIATRETFEVELRVWRADGSQGWVLSRAVPLFDEAGEITEWFGAAVDVSNRHAMQGEVTRLIAEAERQRRFYESLIGVTPDLVYAFDPQYRFIFANPALLEMWGRTAEDSLGKGLLEVGYEPWHAAMHEREIDQVIATKAGIRGEVGFPHATLGWRTYDYIFMPVLDSAGAVEAIAGTTRDITEIRRSEEHLRLLVNELNHRVKNTLTTVQSLARQTFRAEAAAPAARAAFEERLMALSNAHSVLTATNWENASLRRIAAQALAPFGSSVNAERFRLDGEDLTLPPQTALALAMALHELASNAVKYGALSGDAGRVALSWNRTRDWVDLVWQEADGPRVQAPSRKGFGSRLLERGLAGELNGKVRLEYPENGVRCRVSFPIEQASGAEAADDGA